MYVFSHFLMNNKYVYVIYSNFNATYTLTRWRWKINKIFIDRILKSCLMPIWQQHGYFTYINTFLFLMDIFTFVNVVISVICLFEKNMYLEIHFFFKVFSFFNKTFYWRNKKISWSKFKYCIILHTLYYNCIIIYPTDKYHK